MKFNIFFLLFIIFVSCSTSKNEEYIYEKSKENILFSSIPLDSVFVKLPKTSFVASFEFTKEGILFIDRMFCLANILSNDGKVIKTALGKGESPKELKKMDVSDCYMNYNGNHYFTDDYLIYVYNTDWKKIKTTDIKFGYKRPLKEVEKNPAPELNDIYGIKYFQNKITMYDSKHLLCNIESEHPKFNCFFSNLAKEYYEKAKLFVVVDIFTGKLVDFLGAFPEGYKKNVYPATFANWHYDFVKDKIYLNFEAEHQIYIFDKKMKKATIFGIAGKDMKMNYKKVKDYDEYGKIEHQERVKKGYYADIKYFPEDDILFRTYTTGADMKDEDITSYEDNPRRMQVYKGTTLIADVKVPNRFKVIGKIGDEYYADGLIDEKNEKIAFYKFKLPAK